MTQYVQGLTQFWDHLLPTVATSHWLKPPRLLGRSRVGKPALLLEAGTKTYAIVADITHMKSFSFGPHGSFICGYLTET